MSVVCMGEVLIDFTALETGVSVGEVSRFQKNPGGAPANVAVAVKRLGGNSAFISQVGDDPFGYYLAGVLEKEGIDLRGLRFTNQARTMLAFVSLDSTGDRSFSFYRHPSADMLLRPEDIAFDVIDDYEAFHFGSITMISEPSKSATLAAVEYAKKQKKLISYDPNLRLNLWPDAESARAGMMLGFDYANVVKVSDEEVRFLTGGDHIEALWRESMKLLIVTHGADGSSAHTRDFSVHVPGQAVKAVDTTGAGDAFVGAILTGLLKRAKRTRLKFKDQAALAQLLYFANSVGALATTKRGAIPALPNVRRAKRLAKSAG